MYQPIRFFLFVFFGFFLSLFSAQSLLETSDSPIQIEKVVPGLIGVGRYDCWIPLWIHLKSTLSRATTVQIEIRSSNSSALVVSKEVEIPGRGVEPFILHPVFLMSPASYSLHIRLTCKNPVLELQKKEHFAIMSHSEPFFGVLTQKNSSLNISHLKYLENQLPKKKSTRLQIQAISEGDAPIHWFLYQNLDVLFLLELDKISLIKSQEEALVDWVRAGGTLFVNGGDQANSLTKGFLKSLIHFQLKPARQKQTLFPKEYLVDSNRKGVAFLMEPFSESTPLPYHILAQTLEVQTLPLLIEQPIENGKILFSTVDITKEPFKQNVALLKYLLDPRQELFFSNCTLLENPKKLYQPFFSSIQMKGNTFLGITLFLFAYIAGLLWTHYHILKGKFSMDTKIWMFPKIIGLFSLTACVLVLFVSPTQWKNEIHLLHFKGNSDFAIQESLISFSLSKNTTVEAFPEKTGYASEIDLFEFDPARLLPFQFFPQSPPKIVFSDCKQGTARSFRYLSITAIPENKNLQMVLEPKERDPKLGGIKTLHVRVENQWDQPVENLTILGDSICLSLGTLPTGGSCEQEVSLLQEKLPLAEYSPFSLLPPEMQREDLLWTLSSELRSSTASATSDWETFHLVGFVKIPSTIALTSSGKPLSFEKENSWALLHYQFTFPRNVLPGSSSNSNSQEEEE